MAVIKIKNKKGTSEKTPPTGYCISQTLAYQNRDSNVLTDSFLALIFSCLAASSS